MKTCKIKLRLAISIRPLAKGNLNDPSLEGYPLALEWRATHVENFLYQYSLSFKYILSKTNDKFVTSR